MVYEMQRESREKLMAEINMIETQETHETIEQSLLRGEAT